MRDEAVEAAEGLPIKKGKLRERERERDVTSLRRK